MATDRLNGEIADRIRGAADSAGITQQQLALTVGIPDRTFARLLTGTADWKVVQVAKVARATRTTLADLILGERRAA